MAGHKTSDYALDTPQWAQLLESIEKQRKGFIGLSLTNYDNANKPAIAAGSYIECVGALYGFSSEEAIPGDGTTGNINYIMFDPTPMTFAWTVTPPTWSDAKQGWYDAGEAKRYIGGCYYAGGNYTGKWVYHEARDIAGLTGGLNDLVLGKPGIKIGNGARSSSGNQVITGVGFKPGIVIFLASVDLSQIAASQGFDNGTTHYCVWTLSSATGWGGDVDLAKSLWIQREVNHHLKGYISAMSTDGFTITWALTGTVSGAFVYLALP